MRVRSRGEAHLLPNAVFSPNYPAVSGPDHPLRSDRVAIGGCDKPHLSGKVVNELIELNVLFNLVEG